MIRPRSRRTVFLLAIGILALGSFITRPLVAGHAPGVMGANKPDLIPQFGGRASGCDGSPPCARVVRAMGEMAVLDARDAGFGFLRVWAAGYSPDDLKDWASDPELYWSRVDAMFDALDRAGVGIVPSFFWNLAQFPGLTGENVADLMKNPGSRSRTLAYRYITAFVSRYRARKTILFYEMGNEANLGADLDLAGRCRKEYPSDAGRCRGIGNYTTRDLTKFSYDTVALIRNLDPGRAISSGFGAPPIWAAHMERHPELAGAPDWTADSPAEFKAHLLATNAPFDRVSLHIYGSGDAIRPALGVFKASDMGDVVARMVRPLGKQVFVGEFGDTTGATVGVDVARSIRSGAVDYAAVWVWEFRQFKTIFVPGAPDYEVEPGYSDDAIRAMRAAAGMKPGGGGGPHVVLTSPLPCGAVDAPIQLEAMASAGGSAPRRVDFLVDGKIVGSAGAFPYRIPFDPRTLGPRGAMVEARAIAPDGAVARFASPVALNGYTGACDPNR